jgi:hypothetical protein
MTYWPCGILGNNPQFPTGLIGMVSLKFLRYNLILIQVLRLLQFELAQEVL